MNDAELAQNFYIACYHYALNNGSNPTDDFVKLRMDQGGNIVIDQWNHDSTEPTNTDLKVPDLATVQATWDTKTNDDEYAKTPGFLSYTLKELIKEIEVLKLNPLPDAAELETMLRAHFDAFKAL